MDINLPGMSGVECVARLTQALPETLFIMVTVYDDSDSVFESLASGANGYLLKPVQSEQLVAAIEEVMAGGAPMSMSIARRVVQTFRKPVPELGDEAQLWPREMEILELLAKGFLKKEIGDKLGISYWTVQTHVGRIYKKLHVHSRAQAVAKFRRL
jgi:DNA-binding NarL/FixJ family response regulator